MSFTLIPITALPWDAIILTVPVTTFRHGWDSFPKDVFWHSREKRILERVSCNVISTIWSLSCIFHWLRNEISGKCFRTPLGLEPEGLLFESRAQCCLSVAVLLSAIADVYCFAVVSGGTLVWFQDTFSKSLTPSSSDPHLILIYPVLWRIPKDTRWRSLRP